MPEADLFLLFGRRFNQLGVPYMISGSVAVIVYGEPRLTHDVDLVMEIDAESISRLAAIFPTTEFYCPPPEVLRVEAAREQRGHFNIIHHETGFKADVFLAGRDPLSSWGLKKLRSIEVGGETLPIAPPEYVILRKLEYFQEGGSEKHLRDIISILRSSAELVNTHDLELKIAERGLREGWRKVRDGMGRPAPAP